MTIREHQKGKDALNTTTARVLIFGATAAGLLCMLLNASGVLPPLPSISDDLGELSAIIFGAR
jgi:hypothetical protein